MTARRSALAQQTRPTWWERASRIGPIAQWVIIGLMVLGWFLKPGAIYDDVVNVPDVRYGVLPPFSMQNWLVTPVFVANNGRATAHDVLIRMSVIGSAIEHYEIGSEELWDIKDGGEGYPYLHLWLDRLASGSSVNVYLMTSQLGQSGEVTVITEEGPGLQAGVSHDTFWAWWELVLMSVATLVVLSWSLFVALRYLVHRVRERRA